MAGWVRGAGEAGVVYVSLGSMARGDSMPTHHRDLFVRAFARMKQRVIWKYEGVVPGVSDNVMVRRWLPQQDILGGWFGWSSVGVRGCGYALDCGIFGSSGCGKTLKSKRNGFK